MRPLGCPFAWRAVPANPVTCLCRVHLVRTLEAGRQSAVLAKERSVLWTIAVLLFVLWALKAWRLPIPWVGCT